MLFKQKHLEGIRTGNITLAFRKWKRPSVKAGSLIKTAIGQVEIIDVTPASIASIGKQDAEKAGFNDVAELREILNGVEQGEVYRIELRYHSPDPRVELRSRTSLSDVEFLALKKKLDRLDRHSKTGPWTMETLKVIQGNPRLKAKFLSSRLGQEKNSFKINVRKLKNIGLTISHEEGYSISPLGVEYLKLTE